MNSVTKVAIVYLNQTGEQTTLEFCLNNYDICIFNCGNKPVKEVRSFLIFLDGKICFLVLKMIQLTLAFLGLVT